MTKLEKEKIEELKTKLQEEKARLEGELMKFAKPTDVPGNYETEHQEIGSDSDENASEVEEYTSNLALEKNLEGQLKEVTKALEKIENGTYGICDNCKGEIDIVRLEAYPAASNCMECK